MNGTPISRIDDVIRSGFATKLRFSHRQDDQELETGEKSVQVLYSSFELSDTAGDRTSMKLRLQLDANEMWIVDLTVAKPFRLQTDSRVNHGEFVLCVASNRSWRAPAALDVHTRFKLPFCSTSLTHGLKS